MADNLTDPAAAHAAAPPPSRACARCSTIAGLLQEAQARLADAGRPGARLDAELLLAWVLQKSRSHLLSWPEEPVGEAAQQRLAQLLQRAAAGEPLAYLVGEREFWSLPITVTAAVLVPRPETELIVERCLALCPAEPGLRAADLGTGSGAIALALAAQRPAWRITATDRSPAALQVARGNAGRLGLSGVEFLEGDWFAPLAARPPLAARRFDLIVSNPPYIAAADPALSALRHEPPEALIAGPTGLEALAAIIAGAGAHLVHGGALVLEHGAAQAPEVAQRLAAAGYTNVRSHRDLAGHLRVTEGRRPPGAG